MNRLGRVKGSGIPRGASVFWMLVAERWKQLKSTFKPAERLRVKAIVGWDSNCSVVKLKPNELLAPVPDVKEDRLYELLLALGYPPRMAERRSRDPNYAHGRIGETREMRRKRMRDEASTIRNGDQCLQNMAHQ